MQNIPKNSTLPKKSEKFQKNPKHTKNFKKSEKFQKIVEIQKNPKNTKNSKKKILKIQKIILSNCLKLYQTLFVANLVWLQNAN